MHSTLIELSYHDQGYPDLGYKIVKNALGILFAIGLFCVYILNKVYFSMIQALCPISCQLEINIVFQDK